MRFAVIGGDARFVRLEELLRADGHHVRRYSGGEATVEECCKGAECLVLPLPATDGDGLIRVPGDPAPPHADEVFGCLDPRTVVLAGRVLPELYAAAQTAGFTVTDYFGREELTVANAALTAEGAVMRLMEETACAIGGMRVLVVGFGRIGKFLARKLDALGALVTVSARKPADLMYIRMSGYTPLPTGALEGGYDAVVNTVPAPVLGETFLRGLKRDTPILDLASAPGITDRMAAERYGLRYLTAPGLPGKVAPATAAEAIRDTVYTILREGGKL